MFAASSRAIFNRISAQSVRHGSYVGMRASITASGAARLHTLGGRSTLRPPRLLLPTTLLGVGLGTFALLSVSDSNRALAEDQKPQRDTASTSEEAPVHADEEAGDHHHHRNEEPKLYQYKYVIIGAGSAGFSAVKAILENDSSLGSSDRNKILVVSSEDTVPYMRPPLSKELWKTKDDNVHETFTFVDWQGKESHIAYEPESFYEGEDKIMYMQKRKVVDIDPSRHVLLLDDDTLIQYEKCLLATGGHPNELPHRANPKDVTTFRYAEDFANLFKIAKSAKHITVIGGGFIGTELASALSGRGVEVTQVVPESGVLARALPEYLSDYATRKVRELGVEVITGQFVDGIEGQNKSEGVHVTLKNGKKWSTDHVVVAVGITPSNDLAKLGKLEIDQNNGGILANAELQVRSDLYVAGDAVSYYDATLGVRRRIEHYDHAVASGKLAGENMALKKVQRKKSGSDKDKKDADHKSQSESENESKSEKAEKQPNKDGSVPDLDSLTSQAYIYQPMFWSEFAGLGFEAVGIIDAKLPTVSVWLKDENTSDNDKDGKESNNTDHQNQEAKSKTSDGKAKKKDKKKSKDNEDKQHEAASSSSSLNKGFVYYVDQDRVVGVLLWGVHGKVDDARALIEKRRKVFSLSDARRFISVAAEREGEGEGASNQDK